MLKNIFKKVHFGVSLVFPNFYILNYIISAPRFIRGNKRLPRPLSRKNATINDFIFDRMIRNNWTLLEQACVDKEYSKIIANSFARVKSAKTIATLKLKRETTKEDVKEWISPFIGLRFVLKPTHSSGKIIFLDKHINDGDLELFLDHSKKSFFKIARETQYAKLDKKLIIEENISEDDSIKDYKFFCVNGRAVYCQVDCDRFVDHKRAVCSIPDFEIMDVRYGHDIPNMVEKPENFSEMISIANSLSAPFLFVRIDLYSINGVVYFGEYTFSPCAGSDNISNEEWAISFYDELRS